MTAEVNGSATQCSMEDLNEYSTYSVVVIAIDNAGETSGDEQQVTTLSVGMQVIVIVVKSKLIVIGL